MNSIKQFKFKSGTKLQVEVVPLETLTVVSKNHLITPHRTNFHHVFLFENCTPTHLVDFVPIKVKPYSLLFINRDRVHQFDLLLKYEGRVLIFTDDFFCTTESDIRYLRTSILFNDLSDKPELDIKKPLFEKFRGLISEIDSECRLPDEHNKYEILKNLVHRFLLLAEREKRTQGYGEINKGQDYELVLHFRELLDSHFVTFKNVSFYAGKLNVSEKKLGKSTSSVLGKKPKTLIDERTILEAKRLLIHENKPVKEIGFQLGFEETTNFIKYFRKHSENTPLEFRESFSSSNR